ncbi:GPP34 family phosphoprotein [Curtobacterium sp. MEB011]|uniref:GOLPH3/VPS74 family protein n=1 Tax=Curtobacterium sp. MEB011 TaxID=3040285 RepID=UPI002551A54D|nr:GPP34 family phosphoprotein [Curtobacterium sp. MEB011]
MPGRSAATAFALLLIESDGRRSTDVQTLNLDPGGAVLADLALRGTASLRSGLVAEADCSTTGDAVLDEPSTPSLRRAPRKAKWWVQRLGKHPLHEAAIASLADRGVIMVKQGRTLGTFPTTKYPEQHGRPEAVLRSGFADVLAGCAEPTPFTAAVIALLDATGTLREQFGAVGRALVDEITTGNCASPAVKAVLEEIQATAPVAIRAANPEPTSAAVSSWSAERSAQATLNQARRAGRREDAREHPQCVAAVRPVAGQHCRHRLELRSSSAQMHADTN